VNGLRQLWRGGLKAVVGLSSATVLGQLTVASAMPALTRLYTPEAMGVLATFSGIATTVFVAAGLRYEGAIPVARRDTHARLLLLLALVCGGAVALACVPFVVMGRERIAIAVDAPGLGALLWLLPPFVLFASANRAWQALAVRERRFVDVARTRMVQAPATLVPQLGGGLLQLGAAALVVGFILGQTAGLLSLMRGTVGLRGLVGAAWPWRRLQALARRHWRFPVLDMPAAFANTLGSHLPALALAFVVSPAAAGVYAVHQRLLLGPAAIVTQAIGQVLLGDVRTDIQSGAIRTKAPRVAALLGVIAVIVAGLGVIIADPLMTLALGSNFAADHSPYARFVLVGVCAQFVYSPLSVLLSATRAQGQYLVGQLALLIGRAAALAWGLARGSAWDAVVATSLVGAAIYIIGALAIVLHVRRVAATP
jgi:O-antigen/teichoic acid export membrane protein